MKIEDNALPGFTVNLQRLGAARIQHVSVVPDNIFSVSEVAELRQAAEADTVKTLLTLNHIVQQELFEGDENIVYVQNYSDDWFGPTIIIPLVATLQNPHVTSVILGIITNYLYDAFKGSKAQTVKLQIIKENGNGEFRKVSYSGPIEGLPELTNILEKIE